MKGVNLLTAIIILASLNPAAASELPTGDVYAGLIRMDIEDLMNVKVKLPSRKEEPLSETPAAVYVITHEDIRRSGATSIPEALRMAPGVQVAQFDASTWFITVRGFNDRFSNKLLVMIDGRSVYSPLYSGVYWDSQDTLLEDVDRIEIVRGPGSALWGANAVNGIINIVTKTAGATKGGVAIAGIGKEDKGFGGIRYGNNFGNDGYYRAYLKYFDRDKLVDASGQDSYDDWSNLQGGFRIDAGLEGKNALTVQGDIYDNDSRHRLTSGPATIYDKTEASGGNIIGRWEHTFSEESGLTLQIYYDRTERRYKRLAEYRDTVDIDFQHRFVPAARHETVWGVGYRVTSDKIESFSMTYFTPDRRYDPLWSAFVQDKISLLNDLLSLTIGSKFEHNNYTGFEYQPNIRLLWTPNKQNTAWTAITRAVRTPSRSDHDILVARGTTVFVKGNRDYKSEELTAYEAGYRLTPTKDILLDFSAFFNKYDKLESNEIDQNGATLVGNSMYGGTYGGEASANWKLSERWKVIAGYSYLYMDLRLPSSNPYPDDAKAMEKENPENQFHIRSYIDLPHNTEFDTALYYVGGIKQFDVPAYVRLDARFGWIPLKDLELSLSIQNIQSARHPEWGDVYSMKHSEVERNIYGKATWKF